MIRRLNYTNRQKIKRQDISIVVDEQQGGTPSFEASVNFDSYNLPRDASVFIEAYRRTKLMRFPFGTASNFVAPTDTKLSEFDSTDNLLFRVKVSSTSPTPGKLLAEADQISARRSDEESEERVPLLPVHSEDLGAEISRVDFIDRPTLLINSKLGNWRDVARSEVFVSLVLPLAVREILNRIVHIEKFSEIDSEDYNDWRFLWLKFASELPGTEDIPSDPSDYVLVDNWIESVVQAFGRQFAMLDKFENYWKGEQER
jgi:hypothetical protein